MKKGIFKKIFSGIITGVMIVSCAIMLAPKPTEANTASRSWVVNITEPGGEAKNSNGRKKDNDSESYVFYDEGIVNKSIVVRFYGDSKIDGSYKMDCTGDDLYYTVRYKTSKNCKNDVYSTFGNSAYEKIGVSCGTYTGRFKGNLKPDTK